MSLNRPLTFNWTTGMVWQHIENFAILFSVYRSDKSFKFHLPWRWILCGSSSFARPRRRTAPPSQVAAPKGRELFPRPDSGCETACCCRPLAPNPASTSLRSTPLKTNEQFFSANFLLKQSYSVKCVNPLTLYKFWIRNYNKKLEINQNIL